MRIKYVAAIIAALVTNAAFATNWFYSNAHVLKVEMTYMPNRVTFILDAAPTGSALPGCTAGSWVYYESSNAENVKAALSVLTSAYLSGKPVYAVVDDTQYHSGSFGTGMCKISYLGLGG